MYSRPPFAGATRSPGGFEPAGSGTYAGVEAPKSRSWPGSSHWFHSVGTKTRAAFRVNCASPVTRTTSSESDVLRGWLVVSPVTPMTYVPSETRPPDPQMPERGLWVATRPGEWGW